MKSHRLLLMTSILLFCLGPAALAQLSLGDPAPDFTLLDINNEDHSLSDFEGKVVLLFFWQST